MACTYTSVTPDVWRFAIVVALQQHAAEVTDLVNRGMAAMHDAMMKNVPGMSHRHPPGKRPTSGRLP